MDGTFYLGDRLLAGALEFLEVLRRRGTPFLFLTNNSSQDAASWVLKLSRLGVQVTASQIFTAGEATAIYLHERAPGARLYLVGTPSLEAEFRAHGFTLVEDRPNYAVLGFDTTLTYAKLHRLCDLVRSGLPYLATHPDLNCPTEAGMMPDVGAMIAFVKASTGRDPEVVGKPNRPIVQALAAKTGLPIEALCMVGDRLYTDIALAGHGVMTVLVLSGETRQEDLVGSPHRPDVVVQDLGELARVLNRLT